MGARRAEKVMEEKITMNERTGFVGAERNKRKMGDD